MEEIQILLVEDNPADAELINRLLLKAGLAFAMRRVASESSFRRELVSVAPDVILSDYQLPAFDGLAALNIARTLAPDVPFIFVSGTISDERATRALQEGAVDYIVKDRPARLPEAVRRAIAERRFSSQRRDMQAALRQSEQRYHLSALATLDVIWDYDLIRNRVLFNEAMNTVWGYDLQDEVEIEWWSSRVHPEDVERVVGEMNRVFDSGGDRVTVEYRFRRADGTYGDVFDRGLVVRGEGGKPLRLIGAFQDFTERKAAEQRARGAERTIRSLSKQNELILQHAAEGIIGVDREGKLTFANRAAIALAGWPEGTLRPGILSHSVIHPGGACNDCGIVKTLADGELRADEDVLQRFDGQLRDIEYSCAAIRGDDDRIVGAVVTFRDVTSRKRLESQLDQVRRVSSLGRIAATIAHEFNNVLMGISPFVEVIRRRAGTDERLKDAAAHILTSVARGRKITDEILRTTQDRQPALVPVDMREWLPRISSQMAGVAGAGVSILATAGDQPFFARFDPEQIAQVLLNLAANARDAMNGAGSLTIDAAPDEPARSVRIAVADTGSGISPDILPHIFEPLFTTKSKGTGLGLAVAQQMVVRNGGTITVASVVGEGTRFELTLPMSEPPRPGPVSPPAEEAGVPVRRLLLVEDEPAVAAGLSALLALDDIEVRVADTGAAALDAIRSFAPQAVVLDVNLPDADGGEVYDRIAEQWPDLPVIFSTGNGDATRLARQLSRPRVRFLRKPYDAKTLLDTLRSIV